MGRLNAEKTRHTTTISFGAAMVRAALFVLLLPCASALQLPSHGRPRLVPLSHSSSSRSGGLSVRSGPIICKTTDEDWARRWPNATPEELANMKKWCAASSGAIHSHTRHARMPSSARWSTVGLTLTRTRTLNPDPNPNANQGQGPQRG